MNEIKTYNWKSIISQAIVFLVLIIYLFQPLDILPNSLRINELPLLLNIQYFAYYLLSNIFYNKMDIDIAYVLISSVGIFVLFRIFNKKNDERIVKIKNRNLIIGLFLIILFLFNHIGIYPFKKNKPFEKQGNYIEYEMNKSEYIPNDSLSIHLEGYFKDDDVEILNENERVFDKSVSTDTRIGIADFIKIKNKKYIQIVINRNKPIVVNYIEKYNNIFIEYQANNPNITLSNNERFYK